MTSFLTPSKSSVVVRLANFFWRYKATDLSDRAQSGCPRKRSSNADDSSWIASSILVETPSWSKRSDKESASSWSDEAVRESSSIFRRSVITRSKSAKSPPLWNLAERKVARAQRDGKWSRSPTLHNSKASCAREMASLMSPTRPNLPNISWR